jgi:signal transduction histidine kinase
MAKLSTQLSKFDTGYGLQTENIPLTLFIEQYILGHKSPVFEYIYDKRPHHADIDMLEKDIDEKTMIVVPTGEYILREGDPLEYAVFAPEALTIVFNNIISNACVHGFKENGTERNLIRIEIISEGTDYVIAISNNGEPIKELTPQEVLTYGLTTEHSRTTNVSKNHFGIGGYEVKKLMTEFNGDVEIISTPDEEFTVTYRLVFHNTNVKYAF